MEGLANTLVPGLAGGYRGSIDLDRRVPLYVNDNGRQVVKTEESMSFDPVRGVSVTVPTVIDGRKVADRAAIDHYFKTGEYLDAVGKSEYPNMSDAEFYKNIVDARANQIHLRQAAHYPSGGLAKQMGGR